MQAWLGGPGLVGHDLHTRVTSVQGWLDALWLGGTGTVETGCPDLWPLATRAMPQSPMLTVRRPIGEVVDSLRNRGLDGVDAPALWKELERRDGLLDNLEAAGVPRVEFEDLQDASCCAWVFEHLTGLPFSFDWWQVISAQNVQIDLLADVLRQVERRDDERKFARDLRNKLSSPSPRLWRVGREPWESFLAAAGANLPAWHRDVWGDEFPGRPFELDAELYAAGERHGRLVIVTARDGDRVMGFTFWHLATAPQSKGLVVAHQGETYVEPGRWGVAKRIEARSVELLRALGVRHLNLQHAVSGRGAGMGKHFHRLGAIPRHATWSLELT
jgi:hypothetical protein